MTNFGTIGKARKSETQMTQGALALDFCPQCCAPSGVDWENIVGKVKGRPNGVQDRTAISVARRVTEELVEVARRPGSKRIRVWSRAGRLGRAVAVAKRKRCRCRHRTV